MLSCEYDKQNKNISFLRNYFVGSTAFKIKANNPAGIKPVVNNNFNLIPKSGM